jgi:hypothetical protein
MSRPFCKIHPHLAPICPGCRAASGGTASAGITSKAKAKASAANGRLGGRPPLPRHTAACPIADIRVTATSKLTRGCPRCDYEWKKRKKETI